LHCSHLAYGLHITSNCRVPGLLADDGSEVGDVEIHLNDGTEFPELSGRELLYTSEIMNELGQPQLRVGRLRNGAYGLFYSDGPRFAVDPHGCEIVADWPTGYSLEDAVTYLSGPVLAFAVRLRGLVCLHASAVAIEDRAIAFVGSPGSGKSTTSAAFAKNGYGVLSDDVVALTEQGNRFYAQPGYPRVNLWPDSVRALFGSQDVLPRITPTWGKRFLELDQDRFRFESRALPLSVIYVLRPHEVGRSAYRIGPIPPASAFLTLVANTYLNYLLNMDMRSKEFGTLSRLINSVAVRFVEPPDAASRFSEFAEAIAADAKAVGTARLASPVSS
jgi:hypothetical protein